MLVEIWTIGPVESDNFIIIGPDNYVISGYYPVRTDKDQHKIYISDIWKEAWYLGDIEHTDDYMQTIQTYVDTRTVLGCNLIKRASVKDINNEDDEEPPF